MELDFNSETVSDGPGRLKTVRDASDVGNRVLRSGLSPFLYVRTSHDRPRWIKALPAASFRHHP